MPIIHIFSDRKKQVEMRTIKNASIVDPRPFFESLTLCWLAEPYPKSYLVLLQQNLDTPGLDNVDKLILTNK